MLQMFLSTVAASLLCPAVSGGLNEPEGCRKWTDSVEEDAAELIRRHQQRGARVGRMKIFRSIVRTTMAARFDRLTNHRMRRTADPGRKPCRSAALHTLTQRRKIMRCSETQRDQTTCSGSDAMLVKPRRPSAAKDFTESPWFKERAKTSSEDQVPRWEHLEPWRSS